MERTNQITAIRAACIKANPETEIREFERLEYGTSNMYVHVYDPTIRLADVLLAMENTEYGIVARHGRFLKWVNDHIWVEKAASWNLRTDDLEQQSDETITFLAELLT